MIGAVTVEELAEIMADAGKPISHAALRYHCRDPRGALYGRAKLSGRTWMIPVDVADEFAARYTPWGTLRRKTTPETPPVSGAALTESRTPPRRASAE
jgi:hypothetical protein